MKSIKKYPYGSKMLTATEVMELHPDNVKIDWVRKRLNGKRRTVAEVLAEPLLTREQISRSGAKKSPWGRANFDYRARGGK